MKTHQRWFSLAVVCLFFAPAIAENWSGFRGDGNGSSKEKGLPATWSGDENIVWRTPLPGYGASSPIVHRNKIFVTGYSGYGTGEGGTKGKLKLHVTCISHTNGKVIWDKSIDADTDVKNYRGFVALHGYASQTPVTDGKAVYAFFGRSGVVAYDMGGKRLWQKSVGTGTHGFGTGASPLLIDDVLIVNASVESGALVGFNKKTGDEIWRARGVNSSWNTPLLVKVNGRSEVVVSMSGQIAAYDPATGKQLWKLTTGIRDYICTSPIAHNGIIYALGGRSGQVFAIRAALLNDSPRSSNCNMSR